MTLNAPTSPHDHSNSSVSGVMLQVILALLPAAATYTYFFGWGVLTNIVLAILFSLILEAGVLRIRQRPVRPYLLDGSAIVTAMLLAFAIPPYSPWWLLL
ncbi:MAG: electron transport complex subunit RsxD, partial [Gammaproteobacteria bacterium]